MTNALKDIIEKLRNLNNEERCIWLLNEYPLDSKEYYLVFHIIPHFSWGRKDRKILMEYYLSKLPFSSERPYLVFIKISPLSEFLKTIEKIVDSKEDENLDLLTYHLDRILKYEISENEYEKNKIEIESILTKLK